MSANLDDPELQAEADLEPTSAAQPKRKGKKQAKASKAAVGFAALDDDDMEPAGSMPHDSDDDKPEAILLPKAKKGKKRASDSATAFAALGIDSDAEPGNEAEAEAAPVSMPKSKSKKGKKTPSDVSSAFAALDIEGIEDPADGHDSTEAADVPAAALKGKSEKGKRQATDASSAFAALEIEDNEDPVNSVDIAEVEEASVAAPKGKSKRSKKKQTDAASAFAALGLDDENDQQAAEIPEPSVGDEASATGDAEAAQPAPRSKKGKKAGVDAASAFAALGLEDDGTADPGAAETSAQLDEDESFAG